MTPTEFDLIDRYFSGLDQAPEVLLGVGDDAALVVAQGGLALCLDTLVEGVHFPADAPPDSVGHKALAVNLSDLAAMGARPRWALLGLTLPDADDTWVAEFARGFRALAERSGVRLIGGDTTRGPRAITVQVLGQVAPAAALRRSGAQPGDAVYVSGWPGEAALGLRQWREGRRDGPAIERLHRPEPRLALGEALLGAANAAIDVSDGLLADLGHIARASGLGGTIEVERLPISAVLAATLTQAEAERYVLTGGDDYELCFTVPAAAEPALDAIAARLGLPLTRIGRLEPAPGVRVLRAGQVTAFARAGYRHFGDNDET